MWPMRPCRESERMGTSSCRALEWSQHLTPVVKPDPQDTLSPCAIPTTSNVSFCGACVTRRRILTPIVRNCGLPCKGPMRAGGRGDLSSIPLSVLDQRHALGRQRKTPPHRMIKGDVTISLPMHAHPGRRPKIPWPRLSNSQVLHSNATAVGGAHSTPTLLHY